MVFRLELEFLLESTIVIASLLRFISVVAGVSPNTRKYCRFCY